MILIITTVPCFQYFNNDIPLLGRIIGRDGEINLKDVTFMYVFIGKNYINHLLVDNNVVD